MSTARRAALVLALTCSAAWAQADLPTAPDAGAPGGPLDLEAVKRELEAKLEAARKEVKEVRDEMRARLETQAAAAGWQEDWMDQKRKLELVTLDGYLRTRPELFHRFDLDRGLDPSGYSLWPRSPLSASDRTNAGINMRFRLEPTINISEEVRIRAQVDALDNVVMGTTPDYAYSRNAQLGYWYDRNDLSLFSSSQTPPRAGINSLQDSILVRRVWAEVSTPLGILRFGRMGNHWGLGVVHNDGNGIDNDWGDTVDRFMFTAEPLPNFYISPMVDINLEGITSPRTLEGGQPFDLSNTDEAYTYALAAAYKNTPNQARDKLNAGQLVLEGGLHLSFRNQSREASALSREFGAVEGVGSNGSPPTWDYVRRNAWLLIPDLWGKIERKDFRVEVELAAFLGNIEDASRDGSRANVGIVQFGGVLQGEYKLLNGALEVGGEVGFATGDIAPGFGNNTRRVGRGEGGAPLPGDIDGRQYQCFSPTNCPDNLITNFRFNRDYRVDMILFRELLGGVTDTIYVKPKVKYRITQGLDVWASVLYASALFVESTPSFNTDVAEQRRGPHLGVEFNVGARYETEQGLFAQLMYGALIPLPGFNAFRASANNGAVELQVAQAIRGIVGVRF